MPKLKTCLDCYGFEDLCPRTVVTLLYYSGSAILWKAVDFSAAMTSLSQSLQSTASEGNTHILERFLFERVVWNVVPVRWK